jgi:hypothetical protein
MLTFDCGHARILDRVEINENEVTLRGSESIGTIQRFLDALDRSDHLTREGIDKLKNLIEQVEKGEAKTYDLAGLKHRLEHMTAMGNCCAQLVKCLNPVNEGDFAPLLDPQLLKLLYELHSCFGGGKSPPIGVVVTLTYDI